MQKLVDVTKSVSALKSTAPTALAAEVEDLRGAVGKLADTQKRLQGRFDSFRQHDPELKTYTAAENGADDEELQALLRLQSAPASGPSTR